MASGLVNGFVGALFAEGGESTLDALRDIGFGRWTLAHTLDVAFQAVDAGLVYIDKQGRADDAGSWRVRLVGREVERG